MYKRKANNLDVNIYLNKIDTVNQELEQEYYIFLDQVNEIEAKVSALTNHIEKLAMLHREMKNKYNNLVYDIKDVDLNPILYRDREIDWMSHPIRDLLKEKERLSTEVLKYQKKLKGIVGLYFEQNEERKKKRKELGVVTPDHILGRQVKFNEEIFNYAQNKPKVEKPKVEPKVDNRNFIQKWLNM